MAQLDFANNTDYARTTVSQSNIGTVGAWSVKFRLTGAAFLGMSGSTTYRRLFQVNGGTEATRRFGAYLQGNDGTQVRFVVDQGSTGNFLISHALLSASTYYVVYIQWGTSQAFSVEIYLDDGTLITSTSGGAASAANSGAANGLVHIGRIAADGGSVTTPVCEIDGFAIYSGGLTGANKYDAPQDTDTGILWYVPFDEGSGTSAANDVSGATALDSWSASWLSGGIWDGSGSGAQTASPDPAIATFAIGAPTISNSSAPQTISPDPVFATFALAEPTLTPGPATVIPAELYATLQIPNPELTGGVITVRRPLIEIDETDLEPPQQ